MKRKYNLESVRQSHLYLLHQIRMNQRTANECQNQAAKTYFEGKVSAYKMAARLLTLDTLV